MIFEIIVKMGFLKHLLFEAPKARNKALGIFNRTNYSLKCRDWCKKKQTDILGSNGYKKWF